MKKILFTIVANLMILFSQGQCQSYFTYVQNASTTIFTDLSTINSSWSTNYSVTWEWDFGDGNISTQQNPVHTYSNNGIYSPCLTVIYFDSVIINTCISVYCDSIIIGNSIPASWDCSPSSGCYDPGTGLGQYTSLVACQTVCGTPISSWDCSPNTLLGCYDPGTGLGQYSTLSACQAVCGTSTPSWDCGSTGCYDPGTGVGQYTTLAACQAICASTVSNLCDSMTASGVQSQFTLEVNNINMLIDYWVTTGNGNIIAEDSMTTMHTVYNFTNPSTGLIYDTIMTCITYADPAGYSTCCISWIWDANAGIWAKMGSVAFIAEVGLLDKKLIKVVDILGRENKVTKNEPLFYIYDDGTVEKRIIFE